VNVAQERGARHAEQCRGQKGGRCAMIRGGRVQETGRAAVKPGRCNNCGERRRPV
jgi:hypothetical protein